MKLVIEVKDGSNVEVHKIVSATGMEFCLDWFAKLEMQDHTTLCTEEYHRLLWKCNEHYYCHDCGRKIAPSQTSTKEGQNDGRTEAIHRNIRKVTLALQ